MTTPPDTPKPSRYRKRPVEIDAIQYRGNNSEEVCRALGMESGKHVKWTPTGGMLIQTLEGEMLARVDDWIIKGVKGEFYPCKPDIFEATYTATASPQESHKLAEELERQAKRADENRLPYSAELMLRAAAALRCSPSEQTPSVDDMVNRFLGWPLPKTFQPDCGISFDGRKDDEWNKNKTWPIGTNLFTADEARAMFEHAIAASGGAKGDGNG